ncbi:MAG TPA: four helix bundle protein [Candidatus Saccharimonadales bacterium]|nr:four helix bundle protein [Candidatus Saccharimonadales bacterium]
MTIYQTKLEELEKRTVDFSVKLVKQCGPYSKNQSLRPLIDQVIRSATSIGANYAEANNASSRTDFKNKIFIAKKEAAETKYWLAVLAELLPSEDFAQLRQEALELTLIFQKIVSTLKMRNEKQFVK